MRFVSLALLVSLALASCQAPANQPVSGSSPSPVASASGTPVTQAAVVGHYAELVYASYSDSLSTARTMQTAIKALLDSPSQANLEAAKAAWIKARVPYAQTEGYRFYSGPIDAEDGPEGHLNAWPLDEFYIDAVEGQPNAGIINQTSQYPVLSEELLRDLNEKGGDKNISAGYHAIEFLLWGQDLTVDAGAGQRPYTDYVKGQGQNAERRAQYLNLVTEMLVKDLESLVTAWAPGVADNYRAQFVKASEADSMGKLLKGIGTLSASELASERLATPLDIGEREEEHSCFSDNTQSDILNNAQSIRNVLTGSYTRVDGTQLTGPGLLTLIQSVKPELAAQLQSADEKTITLAKAVQNPFDQEIRPENKDGHARVLSLVQALQDQGKLIVDAGAALNITVNTDL